MKTQSRLQTVNFSSRPVTSHAGRPLSVPQLQAVSLVHQLHFVSGRTLRRWGQAGYWSSECLHAKGHMRLLVASGWPKDRKDMSDSTFTKTYLIWLDYDIHPNDWRAKQPFTFQHFNITYQTYLLAAIQQIQIRWSYDYTILLDFCATEVLIKLRYEKKQK